jgi:hypothetical protein
LTLLPARVAQISSQAHFMVRIVKMRKIVSRLAVAVGALSGLPSGGMAAETVAIPASGTWINVTPIRTFQNPCDGFSCGPDPVGRISYGEPQ